MFHILTFLDGGQNINFIHQVQKRKDFILSFFGLKNNNYLSSLKSCIY